VAAKIFEFGEFTLDCERFELLRAGRRLKLERKPMELLILLMSRHGNLVTRSEIAEALWGPGVFVDIEHGINTAVRKIRYVLRDNPGQPRYVQTVSGKGYRFVPNVAVESAARAISVDGHGTMAALQEDELPATQNQPRQEPQPLPYPTAIHQRPPQPHGRSFWVLTGAACIGAAFALAGVLWLRAPRPVRLEYTQLTDFTDSTVAPALSSDGRMLAFIRGTGVFTSTGPVYVKMLPSGEPRLVTNDPRDKYALAFSPDGSEIAYTVLTPHEWVTYTVSIFGGEPHLFLHNAAGLTWLNRDQLLFSQTKSGLHLGVVTATATRGNFRELYFPAHERGMAHYSYASPDRKSALVVEMNGDGDFASCRLISLDGRAQGRLVGPSGACLSAGWSPDGRWMYFTAYVKGRSHLWRQRFPDGAPEQLTFGPTEENGVAVDPDGHSLITSLGAQESAIWIHDVHGERSLSSEGEVMSSPRPSFNRAGTVLYYALRRSNGGGPELWRMNIQSGASEAITPGVAVTAFDISPDEKEVVYSTVSANGSSQLWVGPVDRSSPPQRLGNGGEISPYFGSRGQILFLCAEGKFNYLEESNRDGSSRSKVVPYPVSALNGISPGRHWITAASLNSQRNIVDSVLIPVDGGPAHILCDYFCDTNWSTNGDWLFVKGVFENPGESGRSLAIPVGLDEHLPDLPPAGIPVQRQASAIAGAVSVARDDLIPRKGPADFAYVKTAVHRNLYRISLR
jgi:Tol biopolymer transport system component/DNA-binding winged helix-turn-helix (wHTH) protein